MSSAGAEVARLVAADSAVEVLATGFTYTEGPAWDRSDGALLFNDIPSDTTYRWSATEGLAAVRQDTGNANGMAFDRAGRLIVCQSGAARVVRYDGPESPATVLASHYDGRELNSPNDLVVHSSGDIYFTDPAYGRIPVYGRDRSPELDFRAVFRLPAAGGDPEPLADGFGQPNGICLSPDERVLYVDDTERAEIRAFDLDDGGRLANERVFASDVGPALSFEDARANRLPSGYVDGLKCDEHGNVYVTAPGGLWVFEPGGARLGEIALPEDVANFAWGGEDGRSLFLCCRTFLGRLRMSVRGAAR